MANSENSFADRLGRGRNMLGAIQGFDPAFQPARAELSPAEFEEFLEEVGTLNRETSAMGKEYTWNVNQRVEVVTSIKARVLQTMDFVESNPDWKHHLPGLMSLKNKIRGYRAPRPKPPAPAEGEDSAAVRTRAMGEQSYSEIEGNFSSFIAVLRNVEGYAPAARGIRIALPEEEPVVLSEDDPDYDEKRAELCLEFLLEWLQKLNLRMGSLGASLKSKQRDRWGAFDGDLGLKDRKKRIKKAVSGQYGKDSQEFRLVKGIRL